ncbi:uncharacterized protein LOC113494067 [Trichoplusia ni]|uniref:Uncharacterized protein LOC113494067 n=1 Tax=Trichoplusia ni TaxID=7111 RepID=A0A7E5VI60_TRINI|nr:uncharacterized protein LOC113494067 [Trichoplusia ni]
MIFQFLCSSYGNHSSLNPKSIYVRLGSDYTSSDGETIPVQELHFHPDFDANILKNNLVLIRLEKRIRFSKQQPRIRRILYDTAHQALAPDEEGVLILGWGSTSEDQIVLVDQKLSLDLLDPFKWETCKDLYSENYVNTENFCAGKTEKRGGACNGDVGGPGVVGPRLMGVVSFGAPVCGSSDAPTVFTKIGYYEDWIDKVLKSKPERRTQAMTWTSPIARRHIVHDQNLVEKIYESIKSSRTKVTTQTEYPEEVNVVKETLTGLVKSNSEMVDELLYKDFYDDFNEIFKSEEVTDIGQHVLVNKSIYPIPELHYDFQKEYVTEKLTTSKPTARMTQAHTTPTQKVLRKVDDSEYIDNYEASSNERQTTSSTKKNKKHHHHKTKKNEAKLHTTASKHKHKHHKITKYTTKSRTTKGKHKHHHQKKTKATTPHTVVSKHKPKIYYPKTTKAALKSGHFYDYTESTSDDRTKPEKIEKKDDLQSLFYNLVDKGFHKIANTFNYNLFPVGSNKDYDNRSNKNNKILNSIVVYESDNDNYNIENIVSKSQNSKVVTVKNFKLPENKINDTYDYGKAGNKYDYDIEDETTASSTEEEEYNRVKSKKNTVKVKSKRYKLKAKATYSIENDEELVSEEYAYTSEPRFKATQLDIHYRTFGMTVNGEQIKRKNLRDSDLETNEESPNLHAVETELDSTEGKELWQAFFKMDVFSNKSNKV